ncbi:hypothetical protein OGAPHI_001915 [Ogataea philodendri]|uniref:Uncharacterized protein n=1 Tax=Ogataea philodendri TaxID=1378263 RepID=A0A9P8T6T7_9ASCO|nr:uncharacterized protein OGAPHI_001915 [Ogataea philodendri]KAH3668161.1 hypothetical protein OGAPHI_001915 [Ogataea philodendri]
MALERTNSLAAATNGADSGSDCLGPLKKANCTVVSVSSFSLITRVSAEITLATVPLKLLLVASELNSSFFHKFFFAVLARRSHFLSSDISLAPTKLDCQSQTSARPSSRIFLEMFPAGWMTSATEIPVEDSPKMLILTLRANNLVST